MANYYTLFSEVIPHLTDGERAWLEWALRDPYEIDAQDYDAWMEEFGDVLEEVEEQGHGFGYRFGDDSEWGSHLWLFSEDSGNVDNVISLVHAFLEKLRPGDTWSITWAQTCSKPRVGEFGGGWAVVTAESVESGTTWQMVERIKSAPRPAAAQDVSDEQNADGIHLCPYCSASMGEPETDYDQDGSSVVVWRCPECGAEEHVTRYAPEEFDDEHPEEPGDERVAACQDCGKKWPTAALYPVRDAGQRVAPGEPMPAGECPECGALCRFE
jgi:DNA-directed RNA polymerase subunit RPC12/RpoP